MSLKKGFSFVATSKCSNGGFNYVIGSTTGRCYYLSVHEKTWVAAETACGVDGGGLVIIDSEDAYNEIKNGFTNKIPSSEQYLWAGLVWSLWQWTSGNF